LWLAVFEDLKVFALEVADEFAFTARNDDIDLNELSRDTRDGIGGPLILRL
jgi:hypothetical protein